MTETYLTEEEARTKWCPMANVYVRYQTTGATGNRNLSTDRDTQGWDRHAKCIGSACMMWRQGQKRNLDWKPTHSMMSTGYETHPDDKQRPHIPDPDRGFCGLAVRP